MKLEAYTSFQGKGSYIVKLESITGLSINVFSYTSGERAQGLVAYLNDTPDVMEYLYNKHKEN